MSRIAVGIAASVLGLSAPLWGQVVTVGRMSEEVVRMRLKLEGYRNVKSLQKRGDKIIAKSTRDGRSLKLEINLVSGEIKVVPQHAAEGASHSCGFGRLHRRPPGLTLTPDTRSPLLPGAVASPSKTPPRSPTDFHPGRGADTISHRSIGLLSPSRRLPPHRPRQC